MAVSRREQLSPVICPVVAVRAALQESDIWSVFRQKRKTLFCRSTQRGKNNRGKGIRHKCGCGKKQKALGPALSNK